MSNVRALARIAKQYPQTAYTGFAVSLQSEWQCICRAVSGVEELLRPVGDLIPTLLDNQPAELTPTLRRLLGHGVKQGGMNLRNSVESAARMRQTSVNGGQGSGGVAAGRRGAELRGTRRMHAEYKQ